MNREEAKEYLPIIKAYSEGKVIQAKLITNGKWVDIDEEDELTLCCEPSDYRIKPEPKYRPFETAEECWNEMLKHEPFGFLLTPDEHDYFSICRVFEEKGKPQITFASNPYSDFDTTKVFDKYQFADGTPFGIKEE